METEKKRILKEIEALNAIDDADNLEDHDRLKRLDLIGQVRVVNKKIRVYGQAESEIQVACAWGC